MTAGRCTVNSIAYRLARATNFKPDRIKRPIVKYPVPANLTWQSRAWHLPSSHPEWQRRVLADHHATRFRSPRVADVLVQVSPKLMINCLFLSFKAQARLTLARGADAEVRDKFAVRHDLAFDKHNV